MMGFKTVLAAALVVATSVPALAQDADPAAFFDGKTIRIVVGASAGGGFDTYARMLAPHLGRRLGANVVVDNRPGGGGQTATNQVFRAKPDGLTQYLVNGVPMVLGQVVKTPGVSYDLTRMTWLGRVNAEPWAVMVNKDTPYQKLSDLAGAGKTVTFAALGRADGPSDGAATLCAALAIQCNIVLGFEGTNEASLSVLRGEAEAIVMTDTSVAEGVRGGQARAIGVLGSRRSDLLPDVPTVKEQVALTEEGAFWNDYRANIADVGRSVVAPPEMDPERAAVLREAWQAVLTDPAVIEEGRKANRPIGYLSAEESKRLIDQIFGSAGSSRAADVEDVLLRRFF